MESLWQDLRFGLRTLQRDPGFATVAVLTLALGIGVAVAIGCIAQAAVFRTLPYEAPENLVVLRHLNRAGELGSLSIPEFLDVTERQRVFDSVAMGLGVGINLGGSTGEPERVAGLMVSADLGRVLGVEPTLGRWFTAEDDQPGADRVVILSDALWQRRFAADPGILGQSLRLDGLAYKVVGVLPPELGSEPIAWNQLGDLLVPISLFRDQLPFDDRSIRPNLWGLGRLDPSSSLESAQADLVRISSELEVEFATSDSGRLEATPIQDFLFAGRRPTFKLLVGAAALVLAIGCGNLVNLLLTRFSTRRVEFATRQALGASRGRLWRQLLSESLLLGLLGGLAGLGLAQLTLRSLPRLLGDADELVRAQISSVWLVATVVLAMLLSVLVFLLPILRILERSSRRPSESLRVRGITRVHRLRWGLVAFEIALAFVTLVGGLLMLDTMRRLEALDPGYDKKSILSFKVLLTQEAFDQQTPWATFFDQSLERFRAIPGLERVAVTSVCPPNDLLTRSRIAAGDRALPAVHEYEVAAYQMVSPGFFETLGIPLIQGRDLEPRDDDRFEAERVAVISESLARRFWPDTSALDKRLAFEFKGSPAAPEPQWRRVVGVVGDIYQLDPQGDSFMAAYVPYGQIPEWLVDGGTPPMTFVLDAGDNGYDRVGELRQALLEIDPNQPIYEVVTLDDALHSLYDEPRRVTVLLMAFALLALLLVLVGVYGVVSYIVATATHEIGIRMALGASRRQIVGDLLERSAIALGLGCVVGGVLVRFALEPLVQSQLFGVEGATLGILLLTALALAGMTLLATLVPAWKATRVTPAQALRHE